MFTFLHGMLQREEEHRRLATLEHKLESARVLGKSHCIKCGFCCHKRTCIPTPTELKKIAKFLKLTPTKLIQKYYVIDRMEYDGPYYVKPAGENIKDLVGKFVPAERTFNEGPCIFLGKGNLCKIYPVRPEQARRTRCWKLREDAREFLDKTIKSWGNNQLLLKQFGINVKTD